jgi:hypothetical protein
MLTLSCKGQGYDSIIPTVPDDVSGDSHDPTKKFANKVAAYMEQYIESMEKVANPYFEITWHCRTCLTVFFFSFLILKSVLLNKFENLLS